MGAKRMPKSVGGGGFAYFSRLHSAANRFLHQAGIQMVSPLLTRFGIVSALMLGENPLPTPFSSGIWIFAAQRPRQKHTAESFGQIQLVKASHRY